MATDVFVYLAVVEQFGAISEIRLPSREYYWSPDGNIVVSFCILDFVDWLGAGGVMRAEGLLPYQLANFVGEA